MKKDAFNDLSVKVPGYEPWITSQDKRIIHKTLNQNVRRK